MTKDDYIEWITQQYIDLLQWISENIKKDDTPKPYYVHVTPNAYEELSCYTTMDDIKSGRGLSPLERVLNER
jgi:hypothetical protein